MAVGSAPGVRFGEAWAALNSLVATEGSADEAFVASLVAPGALMRDLADAVHCLCLLHGRHPGVVEFAQGRASHPVASAWLADAVVGFAEERMALVKLVAAVGPLPSTPGQAETEAAIASQRHALDMLAVSDRAGCPIGAAMALLLDWPIIRTVLNAANARIGLPVVPMQLPEITESATVVAALADTPAFERAMLFGAQQMLAQQRALWHLLEARSQARHG